MCVLKGSGLGTRTGKIVGTVADARNAFEAVERRSGERDWRLGQTLAPVPGGTGGVGMANTGVTGGAAIS